MVDGPEAGGWWLSDEARGGGRGGERQRVAGARLDLLLQISITGRARRGVGVGH